MLAPEFIARFSRIAVLVALCSGIVTRSSVAQDPMRGMPGMKRMPDSAAHHAPPMMMTGALGISMDRMGSGTSWIPDAVHLPSRDVMLGHWDVMGHGFAFVQDDRQGGPRGGDQAGSLNWAMLMATRALGAGRLQFRTMLSLDPLTVTNRGYPLLLQSGETYRGQALHDRQHPHDFWMELGALYERPLTNTFAFSAYAAPAGEPALGPVAFMHRPSAMDDPEAPIGHHWQDATHIAFGVLTAGMFTRTWKLEASHFNGREPDENRWNFDPIHLDSWSGRLTVNPSAAWSLSAGYGWLRSPEALHPGEGQHRVTASALHGTAVGTDGQWASAVVWGANIAPGGRLAHSLLAETELIADRANTFVARAEWVQKSAEDLALQRVLSVPAAKLFPVGELSVGYIRELVRPRGATVGIGAMPTLNIVPEELRIPYGSRTPLGLMVFVRVRPAFRRV